MILKAIGIGTTFAYRHQQKATLPVGSKATRRL
jgi:hypothetical protein